ncbi:MAG: hypothetical protein ABI628_09645 [Chloroflexota bacterium]
MAAVDVIILHPQAGPDAGPLERRLESARVALAERHVAGFLAAGADTARVVAGLPDGRPFGARLATVRADLAAGRGLIVLGSGALALAGPADRRAFVETAAAPGLLALANNRFSADVVGLSAAAAERLHRVPLELPGDNALPRWLAENGGVAVTDLRSRWRLAVDLDSPLDMVLVERYRRRTAGTHSPAAGGRGRRHEAPDPCMDRVRAALDGVRGVMTDPRGELVIAGRTSAATLGWLERHARCRVRGLIEERGLRASSPLALGPTGGDDRAPSRSPRSVLGTLLDRDGPAALAERLAELGDAALVDSRVLIAHRVGADEDGWPAAESRFASDLLDAEGVADPWLAALTAAAAAGPLPIVLGGHTLVGPGVRLIAGGR